MEGDMKITSLNLFLFFLSAGFLSCLPKVKDVSYAPSRVMMIHSEGNAVYFTLYGTEKKIVPEEECDYYWFNSNQIYKTRGDYCGRLLDGQFHVLDPKGRMIEKGVFGKGLKQGRWTTWYPNGMYRMALEYKDGKRNGTCFTYDTSGILRKQLYFKNDREYKNVKEFDEKGRRVLLQDSAKVKRKRR